MKKKLKCTVCGKIRSGNQVDYVLETTDEFICSECRSSSNTLEKWAKLIMGDSYGRTK